MSADNWDICPRCLKRAETRVAELERKMADVYGKITLPEYDKLRLELEKAKGYSPEDFRTFREDYEFFQPSPGVVQVIYSGHCMADGCDCGTDFTYEHPFKI